MMLRHGLGVWVFALASASVATGEPPGVLDAALSGGRVTIPLAELPLRVPLAADETFRVAEIGRDDHTSHHVVAIRTGETPHRHDRHDLQVVMLRGHGTLQIGSERRPVGPGSVLYIPRGTLHAFRNASPDIAFAYAVYSPAFDGRDRVEGD